MTGKIEGNFHPNNFFWEANNQPNIERDEKCDLQGVLVLDVDGTLTKPGSPYIIDHKAIDVLSEFTYRGGTCVFNTGATLGRLERTVLNPLFTRLDEEYNDINKVSNIFRQRIFAQPENGSATLSNIGTKIVENELYFLWDVKNALHVPDKENLRTMIEKELVPNYNNSYVTGDHPGDLNPRQYILSWKGLTNTFDLMNIIKKEIIPQHSEINWKLIDLKAARTTIDFINAYSGKKPSVEYLLREIKSLNGPIIGFGDTGDEFAKVIPTINVNQYKPDEFNKRGIPSIDLVDWQNHVQQQSDFEAGRGTAWFIQRMMDIGYFNKNN